MLKLLILSMGDTDCIEFNEAFPCQAIACQQELNINPDKCNLNGSGIFIRFVENP